VAELELTRARTCEALKGVPYQTKKISEKHSPSGKPLKGRCVIWCKLVPNNAFHTYEHAHAWFTSVNKMIFEKW
jgi:hypothetical protein